MRNLVIFALLLALSLAGCGESGDNGGSRPAEPGGNGGGENPPATTGGGGSAGTGTSSANAMSIAYDAGLDFLKKAAPGGNFQDPGLTALAAGAFVTRPQGVRKTDAEFVNGLLDFVVGFQQENGGIYDQGLANYTTCAAVMALAEVKDDRYADAVARAAEFIKSLQTESGGIGYSDEHPGDPDLSNTQFATEALRKAGIEREDPVFSKALKYLMSVQNRSESNNLRYELDDGRIVTSLDDGGAFYKPTESKAGLVERPDGGLGFRSYGSMTYALLKCYLLAGLPKDDPRVLDAVGWIRNHFTLEENPGFDTEKDPLLGQQGLFYYYFTMAKALALLGEDTVKDTDGLAHDWKKELSEKLLSMQRKDGSWVNEKADRWLEGNPVLATSYALAALSCCMR